MPLPLVQFVTTIRPDPHLNPFVKWCDLQFFSKVGSCSRVINSQYVFLMPFVLRCRSSFVVLESVGTPGDIVTIPLKRTTSTRLWLERVTTGNFRNRLGWCYNALQPVVTGFGFFRQWNNFIMFSLCLRGKQFTCFPGKHELYMYSNPVFLEYRDHPQQ